MSKVKPIRDMNGKTGLTAPDNIPKRIELTKDNAPIFAAKFLEGIKDELRLIRELLEKQSG
jgi:hypothetical protein